MIDYLSEIPLPGRILAAPARAGGERPLGPSASIGFVAGPENRLVASTFGRLMQSIPSFMPHSDHRLLALFGPSGTGKTHLASGLVRHWNSQPGQRAAAYVTAADFFRQLIDSIKRDTVADFRSVIRSHDLLAIDDLHGLPHEPYVSQELRFTIDSFEESGGTLLVTSRRAPNTLANLSADVHSRLSAGLLLQLAPPGTAARLRIIQRSCETLGKPIGEQTATRLATGLNGSANDLFGAIFELCASSNMEQSLNTRLSRKPQLRQILAETARHFRLSQAELKSSSRRQAIVTARAVAAYLARELTDASFEQIGRVLGGRDHTTIIHSYRKIERQRPINEIVQEAIDQLMRKLQVS